VRASRLGERPLKIFDRAAPEADEHRRPVIGVRGLEHEVADVAGGRRQTRRADELLEEVDLLRAVLGAVGVGESHG
jgi:hypothetical protein